LNENDFGQNWMATKFLPSLSQVDSKRFASTGSAAERKLGSCNS